LAGALVVALLAIAIYQMVPRGGDPSQPPPTRAPAEATGLWLTAVLTDGGEPLARDVAYAVYAPARDAGGNRKRVTWSNQQYEVAWFALPAGRYFVTAAHKGGNASAETEITAGGTKDVQLRIVPVTKR
jgi:hypothetical protein